MYRSLIPYVSVFWIAGSRADELKIGPLLFCALQIAPRIPRYTSWQADLRVGWLNIALLLDHGLAGWWTLNWSSNVLCLANSTQSCTIYKLTSGPTAWLAQHFTSIVLCPPNNTQSSAIYKLTNRLQGWWPQHCDCLRMVILINYLTLSKNIIFNTKLLILNIDIVQFN